MEFLGEDQDIVLNNVEEIDSYKWVEEDELYALIDHDDPNFTNYKDTIEKILNEMRKYLH